MFILCQSFKIYYLFLAYCLPIFSPEDFLRLTFDLFGEEIIDGRTQHTEPIGFLTGRHSNKLNDLKSQGIVVDREGILSDFLPYNASKTPDAPARPGAWSSFADVIETITEDNESEETETDVINENSDTAASKASVSILNKEIYISEKVWRKSMVPHILNNTMISSTLLNPGRKNRIAKQIIAKKKEEEAIRKLN